MRLFTTLLAASLCAAAPALAQDAMAHHDSMQSGSMKMSAKGCGKMDAHCKASSSTHSGMMKHDDMNPGH